jgi:hypothetical protein
MSHSDILKKVMIISGGGYNLSQSNQGLREPLFFLLAVNHLSTRSRQEVFYDGSDWPFGKNVVDFQIGRLDLKKG